MVRQVGPGANIHSYSFLYKLVPYLIILFYLCANVNWSCFLLTFYFCDKNFIVEDSVIAAVSALKIVEPKLIV